MKDTRRDFLKKAALLSGAAGFSNLLPDSIRRAAAINPDPGSTYMDAEHVVILMQENRSFDHTFGALKGVRGYNDPRAITLPNGNLAWLQSNEKGETFVPFRFDIQNTKITWMGSVPHSRPSQVDAWNKGRFDNWVPAKRVRDKKYAEMPLTMGHYTREDIPFYYAMADAFTVCDQNFCSGMTSTNPNRLFFWTGTVREKQRPHSIALMRNLSSDRWGVLQFDTFPERLEANNISWKFYQNDIDCGGGLSGDQRAWLANFGCNPLEWFANYNVKFSARYIQSLKQQIEKLPEEIKKLQDKVSQLSPSGADPSFKKMRKEISIKQAVLSQKKKELEEWSKVNYEKLSIHQKNLFQRAFTTNSGDPDFHELAPLEYEDHGEKRTLPIPKSDPLYQFRKDVENGNLPTVSWLASAQNFSDHPSAPWYGTLYVSEILDILTQNPEVWKKTIFIVTFDENDGYYDHVAPFVAPDPNDPKTGKCSQGIQTGVEYVYKEDELAQGIYKSRTRTGPIGLGFRVPMVIASPWSRGGKVCSQVFDHTSTLQFLEGFLNQKFNKNIRETNISEWRRTLCGDLTSVFKPYNDDQIPQLPFLKKDPFIERIYNAKFKKAPSDYRALSKAEIAAVNKEPLSSGLLPRQEPGIKPSCAIPYQLYADGQMTHDKKNFEITFAASDEVFGKKALGAGFNIYFLDENRSYTVKAGDRLSDVWPLAAFGRDNYQFRIHGPNGFYRMLKGNKKDPLLNITCEYEKQKGLIKKLSGNLAIKITGLDPDRSYTIHIIDNAYKNPPLTKMIKSESPNPTLVLDLSKSHNWYDFSIKVDGFDPFERRYAGHVETGKDSFTDPLMGLEV